MQNKSHPLGITLVTCAGLLMIGQSAIAQNAQGQMPNYPSQMQPMPMPEHMRSMPMPPRMAPPEFQRPAPPPLPDFPTPDELSRLAPPEPITEEKIKKRFEKRRQALTETLDRDRKSAEKYARDFARYQKYQADVLADIMSRAEKRRRMMLQKLGEQEQAALARFKENTEKAEPQTPPSAQ